MTERTVARIATVRKDIRRGGKAEILHRDQHAWAHAISMALAFPGLRGIWPMSVVSSGGIANTVAGNSGSLSYNGNPKFGNDGFVPYVDLDGTGDFLDHADSIEFDILGTESYMDSPGLTLGGWFKFDSETPGADEYCISKMTGAGNRSYRLYHDNLGGAYFGISDDGTNWDGVLSTAVTSGWTFLAGRFTPSTEVAVWVDSVKATNVAAIGASIFNSSATFDVGAFGAGSAFMAGLASMVFLAASAVEDDLIEAFYQQSRAAYGA